MLLQLLWSPSAWSLVVMNAPIIMRFAPALNPIVATGMPNQRENLSWDSEDTITGEKRRVNTRRGRNIDRFNQWNIKFVVRFWDQTKVAIRPISTETLLKQVEAKRCFAARFSGAITFFSAWFASNWSIRLTFKSNLNFWRTRYRKCLICSCDVETNIIMEPRRL